MTAGRDRVADAAHAAADARAAALPARAGSAAAAVPPTSAASATTLAAGTSRPAATAAGAKGGTPAGPTQMRAMTPAAIGALQAALAAEHAAVYGYGVAGAHLSGPQQQEALRAWNAHRARRDQLASMLSTQGAVPVAAAAAYQLPYPVTAASGAVTLAAALEDGVTRAFIGLVAVPTLACGPLAPSPRRTARCAPRNGGTLRSRSPGCREAQWPRQSPPAAVRGNP